VGLGAEGIVSVPRPEGDAQVRPPPGTMVWWRPKGGIEWRFGYCTHVSGTTMVCMGRHNGDTTGGVVVSINDVEWKKY
jgi:hypothetical protein